jgi:hypothetical protein
MTTQEILDRYTTAISYLERELNTAAAARLELDDAERQISLFEAARLAQGVDGSNEQARKANLLIALESDATYGALRDVAASARSQVVRADTHIQITRERCRLLRLSLALSAPAGVLEATA